MLRKWHVVLISFLSILSANTYAVTIDVDCDANPPGAVSDALDGANSGDTISIHGTCFDTLYINKDGISVVGNLSGTPAIITGYFPQDRVTIDGAQQVTIAGVIIKQGILGVGATGNAGFTLRDVTLDGDIIGVDVNNGSSAKFEGTVVATGAPAFGLEVINSSTVTLAEGVICQLSNNRVGAQISVSSSFFASTGSSVDASNNISLGFSVNTGSTAFFFNANLTGSNNGLDGVDVVSAANLQMDGESELKAENNGREGISVDNSILNIFGFFSTTPGFPHIVANANGANGILLEKTSKLDIGRNASVNASNNNAAGMSLDDGSSATLLRANLVNNNGHLPPRAGEDNSTRKADLVAGFGSRVSFDLEADNSGAVTPNLVGLALCDETSMARGDVRCVRK